MDKVMHTMRTHKEATGRFSYTITRVVCKDEMQPSGRYTVDTVIACVAGYTSRARATTAGRKAKRYHNHASK